MKKYVRISIGVAALLLASCAPKDGAFDAHSELDYCARQVNHALENLYPYDYAQMPRNILATDKREGWNCRAAIAEDDLCTYTNR